MRGRLDRGEAGAGRGTGRLLLALLHDVPQRGDLEAVVEGGDAPADELVGVELDEASGRRLAGTFLRPGGRLRLAPVGRPRVGGCLAWPGAGRLVQFPLQAVDERGVRLVGDHRQLVDRVHGRRVVRPLAVLVDGQPQPAADLLTAGHRAVALLQHAEHEHVGVVPAFAQGRMGEDEPDLFPQRQQPFLVPQDEVVGGRVGRLALLVAGPLDVAVDVPSGLLVDREVPPMGAVDRNGRQVATVRCLVPG